MWDIFLFPFWTRVKSFKQVWERYVLKNCMSSVLIFLRKCWARFWAIFLSLGAPCHGIHLIGNYGDFNCIYSSREDRLWVWIELCTSNTFAAPTLLRSIPQRCRESVLVLLLPYWDTDCHPMKEHKAGSLLPPGTAEHLRWMENSLAEHLGWMAHGWENPDSTSGLLSHRARVCCQPCLTSPQQDHVPCPMVLQQWPREKQDCKTILVSSITNLYFHLKISPFMDNYTHKPVLKAVI